MLTLQQLEKEINSQQSEALNPELKKYTFSEAGHWLDLHTIENPKRNKKSRMTARVRRRHVTVLLCDSQKIQ